MAKKIVVLQSFPTPGPNTNPYIVMLARSLASIPDVEIRHFAWRAAWTTRYDAVHLHWPETMITGRTRRGAVARQILFAALLVRLRLTRTPIVRTVHNLELPRDISRSQRALLRWAEHRTTLWIMINEAAELLWREPSELILLGNYVDWYASHSQPQSVPGRITFVGLIRRYKGVDELIRAFHAIPPRGESLRVVGRPSTQELGAELRGLAAGDDRIELVLDYVEDPQFVDAIGQAQLVALPYREMYNSSAAISALSLARPVLVPDNPSTRHLSDEVGDGWVLRYEGQLTATTLVDALDEVAARPPVGRPDLDRRRWDRVGEQHLAAYRRAISIIRGSD